jgi:hypothetical protein
MAIDTHKYDEIFKRACDANGFGRKSAMIFKAIVQGESTWRPRAYRYEPALFQRMKKKDPYWADKDPSIVSASYGLAQILFTTAWAIDLRPVDFMSLKHHHFQALAETLYDPEKSIFYEVKLMRALIDKIWADKIPKKWEHLSAMDIALARYNGGSYLNPDDNGVLDEQKYVDKVWRNYRDIEAKEAK